ncbi:MAG: hypothetical protein JEZ07_20105 [Phycisphaerae bacterium]|nr:hypothetical protein [Phycisphaerae bacterium]
MLKPVKTTIMLAVTAALMLAGCPQPKISINKRGGIGLRSSPMGEYSQP